MKIKEYFTNKEERTKAFPYVLGFFGIVSVVSYSLLLLGFSTLEKKAVAAPISVSPFERVKISAKSAIVIDVATGKILYEKNADEPLPLASLTKIMTAATAIETANGLKNITLGYSRWSFKNLLDYTLVVSSNEGASAIAAAAGTFGSKTEGDATTQFIKNMNALSKTLGLTQSKFFNEHGLDRDETHVGAIGSARDMATLFEYVLEKYPKSLEATKYPELYLKDEDGLVHDAVNTNISINDIPSLIASKTGFTDLAGGNLIIAFDAGLGRPVIISVLGSTKENRFSDVLLLAGTTLKYFKNE